MFLTVELTYDCCFQSIIFEVDCKVLARVLGNKMYPHTYYGGIVVEAIEKMAGLFENTIWSININCMSQSIFWPKYDLNGGSTEVGALIVDDSCDPIEKKGVLYLQVL